MKRQVTEPNQHYIKTVHILDHQQSYHRFLFGNSRVGKINVNILDHPKDWYNMSYSEGVPKEHLNDIKLFLNSGVLIKEIMIGVDEISCFIDPKKHLNELLRKAYKNSFDPYWEYLLLMPSVGMYYNIKKAPSASFFSPKPYEVIYTNRGSFKPNKKDEYISLNHLSHIESDVFNKPYWPSSNNNNIESTISDIKEIILLCESNNIKLQFFINPIYTKTYEKAIQEGFGIFIEQLSNLSDIYNFSGINAITMDRLNYYENSHYRPIIGDLIINELKSQKSKFFIKKKNNVNESTTRCKP